jgi:hypothetical protein
MCTHTAQTVKVIYIQIKCRDFRMGKKFLLYFQKCEVASGLNLLSITT